MWKQIKKVLLIVGVVAVCCIPLINGCNLLGNPEDPNSYQQIPAKIDNYISMTDMYIAQYDTLLRQMEADGLIETEDYQKILHAKGELEKIKPQLRAMADAIAQGNYVQGEGLMNMLQAFKASNLATVSFNPYAVYIDIGLTIIILVLGAFLKKKSTALNEVVMGVENYKRANGGLVEGLSTALDTNTSESTKKEVSRIIA